MKSLKLLVLTAAVLLLAVADGHARPRLFGRRCPPCQSAQPTAYRKELGAWAALYWATEFVRGPLKAQAKADARPKQPRREADQ